MKSSTVLYVTVAIIAALSVVFAQQFPDMNQYVPIFYQNLAISGTDAIVASRSNSNPNYWYDWVRDSGIAMAAVEVNMGNSTNLPSWYERYERFNQKQFASYPNPNVDIRGDVKFEVDGRVFTGPWGRPQNDGPAYRAMIRINYAIYLLSRGQSAAAENLYRSDSSFGGVKWELDYIKRSWAAQTFDAWEECFSNHFHTLMIARKALYKGAVLAYTLRDYNFALELLFQAANINQSIVSHFDDKNGMIYPILGSSCPVDRKSMDIVVQLAILYGNIEQSLMRDVVGISTAWYNGMCQQPTDQRCGTIRSYIDNWNQYGTSYWTQPKAHHPYNLFSLWNLGQWSKNNFKIGTSTSQLQENVIARYAYDVYDGYGTSQGNPWVLSSFTASSIWSRAGQYYRPNAVADKFEPNYTFYPQQYYMWVDIIQKSSGCAYFQALLDTLHAGQSYSIPKTQFGQCAQALQNVFWQRADDSIKVPFAFLGMANSLPEQINRNTGYEQGAVALTWSYSSLIFADWDRRNRSYEPL